MAWGLELERFKRTTKTTQELFLTQIQQTNNFLVCWGHRSERLKANKKASWLDINNFWWSIPVWCDLIPIISMQYQPIASCPAVHLWLLGNFLSTISKFQPPWHLDEARISYDSKLSWDCLPFRQTLHETLPHILEALMIAPRRGVTLSSPSSTLFCLVKKKQ